LGKFLSGLAIGGFSRIAQLNEVSQAVQPERKYQVENIDICVDGSKIGNIILVTGRGGQRV
jgi:VanZ family protein